MPCNKCHNTGCEHHISMRGRGNTGCSLFSGMTFLQCKSCF